jgi:hypothetical protein
VRQAAQLEVDSVRGKYSQLRGGRLHVADIVVPLSTDSTLPIPPTH